MSKTALEKAQETLERFEKEIIGEGPSQTGEIAIGWAIIAVAEQLEALNKEFRGRV